MTSAEAQTHDSTHRAGFGSIVLRVGLGLMIYLVSVGPAACLHEKTRRPTVQTALETVYMPAVLLIIITGVS
jgi:hypothetical protein